MLAGVIGWPVKHSLSPKIHTAAAVAAGVELRYTAIEVEPGATQAALDRMRREGIRGYSVTMPHKEAVISGLDSITSTAGTLGAVNHITNNDGQLVGNNTDGDGFILGLAHATGRSVESKSVGVVGSGGAARAIIDACARHGADQVIVCARSSERAEAAAMLAGPIGCVGSPSALIDCDIVVNATPLGMAGTPTADLVPVDVASLADATTVVDIVYNPRTTPLLAAARERGFEAVNGVAMLVGQAAEQFTAWTGVAAPLDAMFAAVGIAEDPNSEHRSGI